MIARRLMPSTLDIVLLPGLDGTGRLFKPFVEALPPHLKPSVVSYPTDTPQSYADLEAFVGRLLPKNRPFAIVAESFSGPVAIRIAAKKPKGLMALVLACSFVRHPIRAVPRWTIPLIRGYLFRVSPPAWTIRKFLAGPDAPQELVSEVLTALRLVDPRVLASRVREALSVNVASNFVAIAVPALYLTGMQDCLLAPSAVDDLTGLRPDLEVAAIAAPHFILQRCPTQAANMISDFLLRRRAVECPTT